MYEYKKCERFELIDMYSDVFKSMHGSRPRYHFDWTIEELRAGLNKLDKEIEADAILYSQDNWEEYR